MAISIFLAFVLFVIGFSVYLGKKANTSKGFFAAGGHVHWFVNGIAFAGDYLSAASFLGICGMIAVFGYDGFLYSIGFLGGWIVAMFIIAEPMKRLGKYTFTDALDHKYNHKGIKLAAAVSTLVVSLCYLIPQMVGAGVLIEPLMGLDYHWGVIMVGIVVIGIVATAGMASTTYVQFLKGGMLIVFSFIIVTMICFRGFSDKPDQGGKVPFYEYKTIYAVQDDAGIKITSDKDWAVVDQRKVHNNTFVKLDKEGVSSWWLHSVADDGQIMLQETQFVAVSESGQKIINGKPASDENQLRQVGNIEVLDGDAEFNTGALSPFKFLAKLSSPDTVIKQFREATFVGNEGESVKVYYPVLSEGNKLMRPGVKFKVEGSLLDRLDFISLMLALFCGTAALPHILIRYYTVESATAARKSTIVAIASIGFFYVLTLFLGLGAMVSGVINPADSNMAAPLLARSFGETIFAIVSAIAFATVLGTVSGLIVAAAGAIAHDLMRQFFGMNLTDRAQVRAGKISALTVGVIAIALGICFKGMNVGLLVGMAFAVAASANLPAIVMMLFWRKTTAVGLTASIWVGMISALMLILLSPSMYQLYGLDPSTAPIPFSNPGLVSIPLSFIVLVLVSLLTRKPRLARNKAKA